MDGGQTTDGPRPWFLRRGQPCAHVDALASPVAPSSDGCEECLRIGDTWVHLRMCLTCGKVGCCDNSRNRHARVHHRETSHPVVQSREPGESWLWCYVDERLMTDPGPG